MTFLPHKREPDRVDLDGKRAVTANTVAAVAARVAARPRIRRRARTARPRRMTCSTGTVIGILVRCSLTAVSSSSSSFIMDSPAVVLSFGHKVIAQRGMAPARRAGTVPQRGLCRRRGTGPGHKLLRHIPVTDTHRNTEQALTRGSAVEPRAVQSLAPHTHPTHNLRQPVTRYVDRPPRCCKPAPRPGPCPGTALCRGVLRVLARPMRSQVEVHARNCGELGSHVLPCERVSRGSDSAGEVRHAILAHAWGDQPLDMLAALSCGLQ
jgi:hypothetical protein